jgi:hypothetical protein
MRGPPRNWETAKVVCKYPNNTASAPAACGEKRTKGEREKETKK